MAKITFSVPITRLIHENISIVMNFAFSRIPMENLFEKRFVGEWKYLRRALFDISEERAEKACFELALFLRLLDDDQEMSSYLSKGVVRLSFGYLFMEDGQKIPLDLREVCNKIIHTAGLTWDLSDPTTPLLVCASQKQERWVRAEINIVDLASFCGNIMS